MALLLPFYCGLLQLILTRRDLHNMIAQPIISKLGFHTHVAMVSTVAISYQSAIFHLSSASLAFLVMNETFATILLTKLLNISQICMSVLRYCLRSVFRTSFSVRLHVFY